VKQPVQLSTKKAGKQGQSKVTETKSQNQNSKKTFSTLLEGKPRPEGTSAKPRARKARPAAPPISAKTRQVAPPPVTAVKKDTTRQKGMLREVLEKADDVEPEQKAEKAQTIVKKLKAFGKKVHYPFMIHLELSWLAIIENTPTIQLKLSL